MKAISGYIALMICLIFTSCEEVIDVDLNESEPRLVVEASLIWYKGTEGNQQKIRISQTAAFYSDTIEGIETAEVIVTSKDGETYLFEHSSDGNYVTNNFIPKLDMEYELQINFENQNFTATETMIPVTDIDYVEQSASGGFSGEDLEIKAFYTDPVNEANYYLFKFLDQKLTIELYEDEFTDGNQIFGYYSNEDIEPKDLISIEMQGISKSYYEYMFILRSQLGTNEGGPFETMPATVKGNIINTTEKSNYAFGYFRLSQADSTTYKVQ